MNKLCNHSTFTYLKLRDETELMFYRISAAMQAQAADPLIHDADHYVLKAQHAQQWAADDQAVDAKLEQFRDRNGGKPPNLVYILIDDMGFGDMGIPELNAIRGYKTPNINEFSDQGMRLAGCTPNPPARPPGWPS